MEHKEWSLPGSLEQDARQVQNDLSSSAQAGLALAAALEKARAAAKALASTASRVKRVLSGFDEINRLGEAKKSSSSRKKSTATKTEVPQEEPARQVHPQLQSVDVPSIPAIFCKAIGLTDALEAVKAFKDKMQDLWENVLQPWGNWASVVLVPLVGMQLRSAFENASQAMSNAGAFLQQSWQGLYTGAVGLFQGIGQCFAGVRDKFAQVVANLLTGNGLIGSSTDEMGQRVGGVAGNLISAWGRIKGVWDTVASALKNSVTVTSTAISAGLQAILSFLEGSFSKGWRSGFLGLKEPIQGVVNSIIGFLNKMLSGLGGALNGVINAANRLKFTVPDWVPGIGGKQYGFSLKTVSVPQIPYLAKGAVLPANQPFLAVVGDQKHGTNVEAPLATIQEAVAAVMADHTAGNMAGHEATVAVLRQILEAVLGIDVGEAVIARAAQSYQYKNAVMKGGGF